MSTLPPVRTVHVYSMHTDPFAQPGSGDAGGMNVYIARSVHAMLELDPELRVEVFTLDRGEALPTDSPFRQPPQPGERLVRHSLDLPSARGLSKNELAAVTDDFAQACVEQALYTPDIIHATISCRVRLRLVHPTCGRLRALASRFLFFLLRIRRLLPRMRAAAKVRRPNPRSAMPPSA